jgi:hypothetical protein
MTLKDVRDKLSRMFATDRSLEETEVNHILIEDVNGIAHFDYMLKDEVDPDANDPDDEYGDDSELEDEDDDEGSFWYDDDDDEEEDWSTDDDDEF